jgi:hypothetical protein
MKFFIVKPILDDETAKQGAHNLTYLDEYRHCTETHSAFNAE